MAIQDGTQLQQIGQALGGFSAGIQGRLPEFQQGQMRQQMFQQQQEQLQRQQTEARQQAIYTDAQGALNLAEQGNWDGVIELGMNRLQLLQQFPDADPSDTQRLTQLAVAARNGSEEAQDLLKAELSSTVDVGKAIGVLTEPVAEGATELGKLKQDLNAGLITPEQYTDAVERASMEDLGIVQVFPKDGEPRTLFRDGAMFRDSEGNEINVPADARIIEGSALTGGVQDLGVTSAVETRLVTQQAATRNYLGSVNDALKLLQAEPNINTMAARGASIINDIQQEVTALADTANIDLTEFVNSPATEGTLDDLGIQNNRMRSLITSLAFQAAMAVADSSGRAVSDKDFDRFLKEIGASADDPRAFATVLKDSASRVDRGYRNFYKSARNEDFEGDLGLGVIEEFSLGGDEITEDELAELEELRRAQSGNP